MIGGGSFISHLHICAFTVAWKWESSYLLNGINVCKQTVKKALEEHLKEKYANITIESVCRDIGLIIDQKYMSCDTSAI